MQCSWRKGAILTGAPKSHCEDVTFQAYHFYRTVVVMADVIVKLLDQTLKTFFWEKSCAILIAHYILLLDNIAIGVNTVREDGEDLAVRIMYPISNQVRYPLQKNITYIRVILAEHLQVVPVKPEKVDVLLSDCR